MPDRVSIAACQTLVERARECVAWQRLLREQGKAGHSDSLLSSIVGHAEAWQDVFTTLERWGLIGAPCSALDLPESARNSAKALADCVEKLHLRLSRSAIAHELRSGNRTVTYWESGPGVPSLPTDSEASWFASAVDNLGESVGRLTKADEGRPSDSMLTINSLMTLAFHEDPSLLQLSASKLATKFDCAKSTIIESEMWRKLKPLKAAAKLERANRKS